MQKNRTSGRTGSLEPVHESNAATELTRFAGDERMAPVSAAHVEHLRHHLGLPIELDTSGWLRREIRVRFVLGPERQLYATAVSVGSDVRLHEALAHGDIAARAMRYNQVIDLLRGLRARFDAVAPALEPGSSLSSAHRALQTLEDTVAQRQFTRMGSNTVDVRTLAFEVGFFEGYLQYLERMTARAEELARMTQDGEDTLDAPADEPEGA
jgi:hypothetical protein